MICVCWLHQANKNCIEQKKRNASLFQKNLLSKKELRETEIIDAKDLDVLVPFFYLKFERMTENKTNPQRSGLLFQA